MVVNGDFAVKEEFCKFAAKSFTMTLHSTMKVALAALLTGFAAMVHAESNDQKLFQLKGPVKSVTYTGESELLGGPFDLYGFPTTIEFDEQAKMQLTPTSGKEIHIVRNDEGYITGLSTYNQIGERLACKIKWEDGKMKASSVDGSEIFGDMFYPFILNAEYTYNAKDKMTGITLWVVESDRNTIKLKLSGNDSKGNWTECKMEITTANAPDDPPYQATVSRTITYFE